MLAGEVGLKICALYKYQQLELFVIVHVRAATLANRTNKQLSILDFEHRL